MPTRIENCHKIQNLLDCVPFHFALNLKQFYINKRNISRRQYKERSIKT